MKKKIGKIVALFMAAGLLVNSFFWSAANEGDNGALDAVQEIQENKETLHSHEWGNETVNTPATCNTDGSATSPAAAAVQQKTGRFQRRESIISEIGRW